MCLSPRLHGTGEVQLDRASVGATVSLVTFSI